MDIPVNISTIDKIFNITYHMAMNVKEYYRELKKLAGDFKNHFGINDLPKKYSRPQRVFLKKYLQDLQKSVSHIEGEEWHDINVDWEFKFSNCGRLRSKKTNKLYSAQINLRGYPWMNYFNLTPMYIDRKLCEIYHPPANEPDPQNCDRILHINRVPFDYSIENLKWVSYLEFGRAMMKRNHLFYYGVERHGKHVPNVFRVIIFIGRTYSFATYKTAIDAAYASDLATLALRPHTRKEFLNNINKNELETPAKELRERVNKSLKNYNMIK